MNFELSCCGDLDLDPMTFIYELDIALSCTRTSKINSLRQGFRKLSHYRRTDRQRDIQTDATKTLPRHIAGGKYQCDRRSYYRTSNCRWSVWL